MDENEIRTKVVNFYLQPKVTEESLIEFKKVWIIGHINVSLIFTFNNIETHAICVTVTS